MKHCPDCGEAKPLDDFHLAPRNRDGRNTYCAPCAAERSRRWYEANKARARARQKAYDIEHAEEVRAAARRWRAANRDKDAASRRRYAERYPERKRASSRRAARRRIGWTDEMVAASLESQGGRCAICLVEITEATCHADHCHATERPRGLLCEFCNHGLGRFRDDVDSLKRAITYLTTHGLTVTA